MSVQCYVLPDSEQRKGIFSAVWMSEVQVKVYLYLQLH